MKQHIWVPMNNNGGVEVDFTGLEPIFHSPAVQRLNFVEQLPLVNLRFPDGRHPRLGHSVGTAYIAEYIGEQLCKRGECDADTVRALKVAGLIHDLGHPAYSHVSESITKLRGKNHEDVTLEKVAAMRKTIDKCTDATLVLDLLSGKHHLSAAISSIAGADKVDYTMRDRHHCGLDTNVDARTLYEGARIIDGTFAFEEKSDELEKLLRDWWDAYQDIYLHSEVEIPRAMFRRAMLYHICKTGWDPDDVYEMVDYELQSMLASSESQSSSDLLGHVCNYGAPYTLHGLLCRTPSGAHQHATTLTPGDFNFCHAFVLEQELSKDAKVKPHEIIVTISDDFAKLSTKTKTLYEAVEGKALPYFDRHPGVTSDLDRQQQDHFGIRIVTLTDCSLPSLSDIEKRCIDLAKTQIQLNDLPTYVR